MFQILALHLYFEGEKIIYVLYVHIWSFGGCWRLASWSSFGYGHCSLIYPRSKFWLSILILKLQSTTMSFKSSFGALEDAGGSWLGFGILIFIWIWSWVLDLALVIGFGCGFWLLLWFMLSRGKKICWFHASGSGSGSGGWVRVWVRLRLMIS